MRFIVLIALLGLAAASCPYNDKRKCFKQLLKGYGGGQQPQYSYLDQDEYDEQDDEIDTDDFYGQQQPGCFGGQCSEEDNYEQDEEEQCQGPECYSQSQSGQQGQCKPTYNLLRQLEEPNCALAAKLYKQAKQERDDKNVVISPVAVQLTLAALQKGAQGNTKAQIKRAQCAGLSQRQCQQANAALIRVLKGTNNVQKTQKPGQSGNSQQQAKINCATGIIVNQQTCAQRQFVQTVEKCLGGRVQKCSFKSNPQQCRQQINRLVSAKTCQKVKSIVPQDAVTDNTKMVAVSALQLQAKWSRQFRQKQTTKLARFYPLGSQKPKQCQAIQSRGVFNYYEDERVKVVGIPTQQRELTVYVIVPKAKDGLTQIEKEQIQNGQQLKQLLDICDQQKQYTSVQLPKVQVSTKLDAKKTLLQQGIQDAFDCDQADFSGICNKRQLQEQRGENLHLNKLIHQATIKITEQGICAANTGSQSTINDEEQIEEAQNQPRSQYYDDQDEEIPYGQKYGGEYGQQGAEAQVKANRAFAFAVKHKKSNQIILVGRVIDGCQKPQGQQPQPDEYGFQGQQEETYDEIDEE